MMVYLEHRIARERDIPGPVDPSGRPELPSYRYTPPYAALLLEHRSSTERRLKQI
jgi:hypothetical protein